MKNTAKTKIKNTFANEQVAATYMYASIDDMCIDNYRFAYADNPAEVEMYHDLKQRGCCGFYDEEITVNGRAAMIGCNYGH